MPLVPLPGASVSTFLSANYHAHLPVEEEARGIVVGDEEHWSHGERAPTSSPTKPMRRCSAAASDVKREHYLPTNVTCMWLTCLGSESGGPGGEATKSFLLLSHMRPL